MMGSARAASHRRPAGPLRRRALQALVLLALAQPSLALPCTLEQLLRLPLEQLLRIEFTARAGQR